MEKFIHSVTLDKDLCKGCINCIKRCPTEAIRVRDGKAHILAERCIDCGECIRICPHHAKKPLYDPLTILDDFKYTIALPPPSLYGQYNNLEEQDVVLAALLDMGFDDVYEVAKAAELVSDATRRILQTGSIERPVISSACPAVTRLIRVRFPQLIDHVLPLVAPIELAARLAKKEAVRRTGLPKEDIGCIFITPCPAKVTAIHSPIGSSRSEVDGAVAIKEVYPRLLASMKRISQMDYLASAGRIGLGWAESGGEAAGLISTDSYLAADGIENVIRVLEDLEDEKFEKVPFIELNACDGGCVGGVLNIENPFVARAKIMRFQKELLVTPAEELLPISEADAWWTKPLEYEPVYQLGSNFMESIAMMKKVDDLLKKFPGLDCGCCGAPSCKALAQDIVRGYATENACIHILKDRLHLLSQYAAEFANNEVVTKENMQEYIETTRQYINKMSNDIEALDNTIGVRGVHQRVEPETGSDLKPMPSDD